ncbi:hypothetical protein Tco_0025428 [Tanacetum coccineum]
MPVEMGTYDVIIAWTGDEIPKPLFDCAKSICYKDVTSFWHILPSRRLRQVKEEATARSTGTLSIVPHQNERIGGSTTRAFRQSNNRPSSHHGSSSSIQQARARRASEDNIGVVEERGVPRSNPLKIGNSKTPTDIDHIYRSSFHYNNSYHASIKAAPFEALKVENVRSLCLFCAEFVEEPIEITDREVKRLKRSRIPLVKVRWNSKRGPEFTWEREDQFRKKYPHLFTKNAPSSSAV